MGIGSLLFGNRENVLYFPGEDINGVFSIETDNYIEIMNRLGISYETLEGLSGSGLFAYHAGDRKLAKRLAEKMHAICLENSITKIITPSAFCFHMFRNIYPKLLRRWDITVEHISESILRGLLKKRIRYGGSGSSVEVVYHDSCFLGRQCGIYESPRRVIELLGGRVVEFRKNKENAICCGAGGGLKENFPETANKIARSLVLSSPQKDAPLISACTDCYLHLKTNSDAVSDFSSFVLGRLRGLP